MAAGKRMMDTTPVEWHKAYKTSGVEGTPAYYAQTGTSARVRKPVVRTWSTIGADGVTGSSPEYYMESEADRRQVNVHVENRYWWNRLAHNQQANWPRATGTTTAAAGSASGTPIPWTAARWATCPCPW